MRVALRKLRDWIYNRLHLDAPEVCVFCGTQTGLALPYEVSKWGWPCCADCQPAEEQEDVQT